MLVMLSKHTVVLVVTLSTVQAGPMYSCSDAEKKPDWAVETRIWKSSKSGPGFDRRGPTQESDGSITEESPKTEKLHKKHIVSVISAKKRENKKSGDSPGRSYVYIFLRFHSAQIKTETKWMGFTACSHVHLVPLTGSSIRGLGFLSFVWSFFLISAFGPWTFGLLHPRPPEVLWEVLSLVHHDCIYEVLPLSLHFWVGVGLCYSAASLLIVRYLFFFSSSCHRHCTRFLELDLKPDQCKFSCAKSFFLLFTPAVMDFPRGSVNWTFSQISDTLVKVTNGLQRWPFAWQLNGNCLGKMQLSVHSVSDYTQHLVHFLTVTSLTPSVTSLWRHPTDQSQWPPRHCHQLAPLWLLTSFCVQ